MPWGNRAQPPAACAEPNQQHAALGIRWRGRCRISLADMDLFGGLRWADSHPGTGTRRTRSTRAWTSSPGSGHESEALFSYCRPTDMRRRVMMARMQIQRSETYARWFGGNCGVGCEAAGFGGDLGIDLNHGSVAVFEDVVLVVEFSEALGQGQLMSVALVNPEG